MALNRKKSVSPLRHQFPSPDSPIWALPSPPSQAPISPGYILEYTSSTRRRRSLSDSRDLRAEILAESRPGVKRLFVLRGLQGHVLETLAGAGGVDQSFLDAHINRREWRPSRRILGDEEYGEDGESPTGGVRCRIWGYPEVKGGGRDGRRREVAIVRVSLWETPDLKVLICDKAGGISFKKKMPKLRHQDAATRASNLKTSNHYGAVDVSSRVPSKTGPEPRALDDEITEILSGLDDLGEALGETVYNRWLAYFDSLASPPPSSSAPLLWSLLHALEQNHSLSRHIVNLTNFIPSLPENSTPSPADWQDLISRLHLRLSLIPPPSSLRNSRSTSERLDRDVAADRRSLDRVTYLGGLLLPMTVVSSILAIEGSYGPGGSHFWVFWVISIAASAVAMLVIYIDQVRRLHVWIEDAFSDSSTSGGETSSESGEDDEDGVRGWRRRELGWGGAVKKVSGYYRWRGMEGMRFDIPGRRRRGG